jgi:hypothetical protein
MQAAGLELAYCDTIHTDTSQDKKRFECREALAEIIWQWRGLWGLKLIVRFPGNLVPLNAVSNSGEWAVFYATLLVNGAQPHEILPANLREPTVRSPALALFKRQVPFEEEVQVFMHQLTFSFQYFYGHLHKSKPMCHFLRDCIRGHSMDTIVLRNVFERALSCLHAWHCQCQCLDLSLQTYQRTKVCMQEPQVGAMVMEKHVWMDNHQHATA